MNSEQLSMDFLSATPPPIEEGEAKTYEALDHQLANLMHQLNGEKGNDKNPILEHCTLEISQHTREGQIAIKCSEAQQAELLKTHVVGKAGDYKPLVLDNGYLYLRRYWQYQQQLADQIKSRINIIETDEAFENWSKQRLDFYFGENAADTDWQKIAAERALKNPFLIISGGPGTGKTTTITRILALLIEANNVNNNTNEQSKILLAAPTGKASIRMLDAINEAQGKLNAPDEVLAQMPKQANTIHKLLGYIPEKVGFKHNRNHPLNADVVLIDEASMIDIALMSKLIEAVPAHAKLILIGDKDQLSSVETGSVFADMCEGLSSLSPAGGGLGRGEKLDKSEEVPAHIITLQKNYRFKQDSAIGQLAQATNQGNSKKVLEILKDESQPDCQLIAPSLIEGNQIPDDLIAPWDNYFSVLNNPESSTAEIFQAFNQYRILCTLRRGLNGSTTLSSRIESALAKKGLIKLRTNYVQNQQAQNWYHGRPVMITQNSYGKGLFNGDTGITLIRNGETKVYFPDGGGDDKEEGAYTSIAPVRLPAFETTWAMTIHKSQGSEFNQVALILPHEVMPLLTRQLIYTGITRAKDKVSIVANEAILNAGVRTEMVKATRIADTLNN